jgi:hypothetical protein
MWTLRSILVCIVPSRVRLASSRLFAVEGVQVILPTVVGSVRAYAGFHDLSSNFRAYAPSLLGLYRYGDKITTWATTKETPGMVDIKAVTCRSTRVRDARLCVRRRDGRMDILRDVLYATWAGNVRGTAVAAPFDVDVTRLSAFLAWRSVLADAEPELMRIKDEAVVPVNHPDLKESDAFAVVVSETDRMTWEIVDVRVDGKSFPFVMCSCSGEDLRVQILAQCDWRVRALLSKLNKLPPIVDGVMTVVGGELCPVRFMLYLTRLIGRCVTVALDIPLIHESTVEVAVLPDCTARELIQYFPYDSKLDDSKLLGVTRATLQDNKGSLTMRKSALVCVG